MGAFSDYLFELWRNWIWFMTGGPFVAERITKQIWPGYDTWAARYLAPATRQKLVAGAAIVGIFIATFLAFRNERPLLIATSACDQDHIPVAEFVTAAGTDQKSAAPVTGFYTLVSPSRDKGGVILQPNGRRPITLRNTGNDELLVYPPFGAEINDGGVNNPVSLPYEDTFICVSPSKCVG